MRFLKTAALVALLYSSAIVTATAQSRAEVALVKQVLSELQRPSIRENVEFCGFIGYDKAGRLIASPAARGDEASCLADDPVNIVIITASYHTHGAWSLDYSGEIPSGNDVEADEAMGIDGYVSTPGGRLWYIDTTDMEVSQICGFGCLPRDRRFQRGGDGHIAQSYTYEDLIQRLEEY